MASGRSRLRTVTKEPPSVKDVLAIEMKIPQRLAIALEKEKHSVKISKEFKFFKSYILDTF